MRRLIGWLAGIAGVAALARLLSRRHGRPAPTAPAPDPAEELRRRLAAARETEPAGEGAPEAEADLSLDERRARVHEKAQEAIDAMREDGP